MASHNQIQLGQASSQRDDECPVIANLSSLSGILADICNSLNYQISGNCETLDGLEIDLESKQIADCEGTQQSEKILRSSDQSPQSSSQKVVQQSIFKLKAFRREQVDLLVRKPVKKISARLLGVQRIIENIKLGVDHLNKQIEEVKNKRV